MRDELIPWNYPEFPGGRTVNVAALFDLGKFNYNMARIVLLKDMGFSRNPRRFTASVDRIRVEPPAWGDAPRLPPQDVTALVYHTGKVVLTGASNTDMALSAAWNLTYLFNSNGIPARMQNFQVENIVAKFHTGFFVNLDAFKHDQGEMVAYDPGNFTAAIYEGYDDHNESFTVLVYKTGSLVITGSRTREEALERYITMCLLLSRFKMETSQPKKRFREDIDIDRMGKALHIMTASFATEQEGTAGAAGHAPPASDSFIVNLSTSDAGAGVEYKPAVHNRTVRYEPPAKRPRLQS